MKRSKSSHLLVSKSSQTLTAQIQDKGAERLNRILSDAETLFERGEYENAFVKFSRGAALKPKDENFVHGVRKSQTAIMNDLKGTGDVLRELKEEIGMIKPVETGRSTKSVTLYKAFEKVNKNSPVSDGEVKSEALKTAITKMKEKNERMYNLTVHDGKGYRTVTATAQDVKEYLKDKDYFKMKEQTAKEWKKLRKEMNKKIAEKEATERYQKEAKILEEKTGIKHHCEEQVQLIGRYYQNGKIGDVIRFSENFIKYLNKKVDKALPRKWIYLATAFNYLARAHADQGTFDQARIFGEKLYKIAICSNNTELIVQSYILSGKIYVKFAKYEEAAFVWEKLIPLIQDAEKKAWLFHEIGRCYFELGKLDTSYKFGSDSVSWAEKSCSSPWICTANVFVGQIEMKRNKYREALVKFLEAKKHAELVEDTQTLKYIKSVEDILNVALNREDS